MLSVDQLAERVMLIDHQQGGAPSMPRVDAPEADTLCALFPAEERPPLPPPLQPLPGPQLAQLAQLQMWQATNPSYPHYAPHHTPHHALYPAAADLSGSVGSDDALQRHSGPGYGRAPGSAARSAHSVVQAPPPPLPPPPRDPARPAATHRAWYPHWQHGRPILPQPAQPPQEAQRSSAEQSLLDSPALRNVSPLTPSRMDPGEQLQLQLVAAQSASTASPARSPDRGSRRGGDQDLLELLVGMGVPVPGGEDTAHAVRGRSQAAPPPAFALDQPDALSMEPSDSATSSPRPSEAQSSPAVGGAAAAAGAPRHRTTSPLRSGASPPAYPRPSHDQTRPPATSSTSLAVDQPRVPSKSPITLKLEEQSVGRGCRHEPGFVCSACPKKSTPAQGAYSGLAAGHSLGLDCTLVRLHVADADSCASSGLEGALGPKPAPASPATAEVGRWVLAHAPAEASRRPSDLDSCTPSSRVPSGAPAAAGPIVYEAPALDQDAPPPAGPPGAPPGEMPQLQLPLPPVAATGPAAARAGSNASSMYRTHDAAGGTGRGFRQGSASDGSSVCSWDEPQFKPDRRALPSSAIRVLRLHCIATTAL